MINKKVNFIPLEQNNESTQLNNDYDWVLRNFFKIDKYLSSSYDYYNNISVHTYSLKAIGTTLSIYEED